MAFLALAIFASSSVFAENYPFSAGIFALGKGSINTADPVNGIKNAMTIVGKPDLGLNIYIPLGKENKVGASIDVAWNNLSYNMYSFFNKDINTDINYSYFTIAPSLHAYGFLIGVGYSVPLDVTTSGTLALLNYKSDNLQPVIDFRIGGSIPLYSNFFGRVNLLINATYNLTGAFKEDVLSTLGLTSAINPKPASIQLGVNYLFHIGNFY